MSLEPYMFDQNYDVFGFPKGDPLYDERWSPKPINVFKDITWEHINTFVGDFVKTGMGELTGYNRMEESVTANIEGFKAQYGTWALIGVGVLVILAFAGGRKTK